MQGAEGLKRMGGIPSLPSQLVGLPVGSRLWGEATARNGLVKSLELLNVSQEIYET